VTASGGVCVVSPCFLIEAAIHPSALQLLFDCVSTTIAKQVRLTPERRRPERATRSPGFSRRLYLQRADRALPPDEGPASSPLLLRDANQLSFSSSRAGP
jgi:hypothetical protein